MATICGHLEAASGIELSRYYAGDIRRVGARQVDLSTGAWHQDADHREAGKMLDQVGWVSEHADTVIMEWCKEEERARLYQAVNGHKNKPLTKAYPLQGIKDLWVGVKSYKPDSKKKGDFRREEKKKKIREH